MINDYTAYFAVKENCFFEMLQVRKNFTTALTLEGYTAAIKGLNIMSFYCPDEIKYMVEALVNETERRRELVAGLLTE